MAPAETNKLKTQEKFQKLVLNFELFTNDHSNMSNYAMC
jgi:hypothetical protein